MTQHFQEIVRSAHLGIGTSQVICYGRGIHYKYKYYSLLFFGSMCLIIL